MGPRPRGSATRSPRFRTSDGRRVIAALPARVAERGTTGTGRSLRHEALLRPGPHARPTAIIPQQRVFGMRPNHTPATTSLLHARRQQVVLAAPLRGGIGLVGGVSYEEALYPFYRATNETPPNPRPLPPPGGCGNPYDLPRRLRPRAFLVALGPGADRFDRRRRVATVARGGGGGEVQKARNVDGLYRRLAYIQHMTGHGRHGKVRRSVRSEIAALPPPQGHSHGGLQLARTICCMGARQVRHAHRGKGEIEDLP